MPNLFDRLSDLLGNDDDQQPAGLTPLDIADLPDDQRRVMFALLRHPSASKGVLYDDIQPKLSDLENLEQVLGDLVRQSWLIMLGEPPTERYKVNLRRKRGSALSMWSSLNERLSGTENQEDE